MRSFVIRNPDALCVPFNSLELQVLQVLPGYFCLTREEAGGAVVGYMWMVNPSTNNYTAYYVLTQGTGFPIDLDGQPLVFTTSEEFGGVSTPYKFWETAAGLLGEDMQDVVRAVQQETVVPWPS
jgi:hypothetical protein